MTITIPEWFIAFVVRVLGDTIALVIAVVIVFWRQWGRQ